MASGFTVTADTARHMLVVEMSGFFAAADVTDAAAARLTAFRKLTGAPNAHVTLVDVTACKIQPQLVVNDFSSLIADPRYAARRIAFVVGSSLARMQVRRILGRSDTARCFDDRASAEAWLLE